MERSGQGHGYQVHRRTVQSKVDLFSREAAYFLSSCWVTPPWILQSIPERQSRFPVFLIDDGLLYGRFRKDQGMGPFNQWVTSTFLPRGLLSAIETRRIGFEECECGPSRQGLGKKYRWSAGQSRAGVHPPGIIARAANGVLP